MIVTQSILIQLTLAIQNCADNYNNKPHENPTNSGVTDTRPQTERQADVACT
jgi:hypothetical protein